MKHQYGSRRTCAQGSPAIARSRSMEEVALRGRVCEIGIADGRCDVAAGRIGIRRSGTHRHRKDTRSPWWSKPRRRMWLTGSLKLQRNG